MAHTVRSRAQLLGRVRRLRGQVEAVERALAGEHECADVLQQLAAIRGAASGLMATVLEGHVRDHLRPAKGHDLAVLLAVIRSYLR